MHFIKRLNDRQRVISYLSGVEIVSTDVTSDITQTPVKTAHEETDLIKTNRGYVKTKKSINQLKPFPSRYVLPIFPPKIQRKLNANQLLSKTERALVVDTLFDELSSYFG